MAFTLPKQEMNVDIEIDSIRHFNCYAANTHCVERSTGAAAINVAPFSGEEVHTYIGFIAANGKDMSNSFYTGELTV